MPEGVSRESFQRVLKSFQDVMSDMLESGGMSKGELDQILRNLKRIDKGKDIFFKESKNKPGDIERLLKQIKEIIGETISAAPSEENLLDPLDSSGSSNIARAPKETIILFNEETNDNQQPPTFINESSNLAMNPPTVDPYSSTINFLMVESGLTA